MKTIQRTISLEPMTSRLPGILPAYKDNVLYFFDDESLKKREYMFTSNYGMVPINIMLDKAPSGNTSWNFSYDSHCYGGYGEPYDEFSRFTLSWAELSKWYSFFIDYYHLLNDYGHCGTAYSSATHYYLSESKNGYASQMKYGGDRQVYTEMDELFAERGGIVEVVVCDESEGKCNFDNCHDHTVISESRDNGFFKWICENVVPTFIIPSEYKDYWQIGRLFYPDVIRWVGWMADKSGYEGVECKESVNCCECDEWNQRGGTAILRLMRAWLDAMHPITPSDLTEGCAIPTLIMPISLQTSIDNLGEFSILPTDYELSKDYRVADGYGKTTNTKNGTVAIIDGVSMILDDGPGFEYNETYMEKYSSKCNKCEYEGVFARHCPKCGSKDITVYGWSKYEPSDDEIYLGQDAPYKFYYAFNKDDIRISGHTEDEVRSSTSLSEHYSIERCDAVLIDGVLYDVQREEFGEYDDSNQFLSGKTFYVYREEYTETPYTLIGGKKVYADFYPFGDICDQFFYFPFFKNQVSAPNNDTTCKEGTFNPGIYKKFPRTRNYLETSDYREFITYAGTQHAVDGTGLTINGSDYQRITSGTSNTPDGIMYVTEGNKVLRFNGSSLEDDDSYLVSVPSFEIYKEVDDNIQVYVGGVITGTGISKIYELRSSALLTDDVGNTIEGLYDVSGHYNHQPPEGERIEPIYQVGNVANVSRFSMTVEKQEDLVPGSPNYFVGDIITSMRFYYKDLEGVEVTETSVYADAPSVNGETTSLRAIQASTDIKESIEDSSGNDRMFDDDIWCDITYYIGATLQRNSESSPFVMATSQEGNGFSSGICYTESVKFVETEVQYYLKSEIGRQIPTTKASVSAHTVSYPITCYVLWQDKEKIESDFNNYYHCAIAKFEMPMKTTYKDFEMYNGTQVLPVFRQEYKLGTACIENVDSDIYIDRGINAAFEKHLKLGEVTSIETLENYGGSYFKIMNNE